MENKLTEQDIFVGATVIRADGLKGKVTELLVDEMDSLVGFTVLYENSDKEWVGIESSNFSDKHHNYINVNTIKNFYLVGRGILGNRIEVSEIDEQITSLTAEKSKIDAQIDQLRKQRFRLNNQMDGRTVAERKAEEQTRPKKDDTHERMRLEQIRHEKQRLQAEASKIFKSIDEKKKKDGD